MNLFRAKREVEASNKEAAVYLENARKVGESNQEVAETLNGLVQELLREQEEKKQARLKVLRDRHRQ